MVHRHHRETYYVVDEGRILEFEKGDAVARVPSATEQQMAFRFSRFGEKGSSSTRRCASSWPRP